MKPSAIEKTSSNSPRLQTIFEHIEYLLNSKGFSSACFEGHTQGTFPSQYTFFPFHVHKILSKKVINCPLAFIFTSLYYQEAKSVMFVFY